MKEFDEWVKANFIRLSKDKWRHRFFNPFITDHPETITTEEILNKYKEYKEK